jgi:hypothetical protein
VPESSYCRCCGKPLTDPVSRELGIGPVCRISRKEREAGRESLFANRATYGTAVVRGVVCLIDLDAGKTITNDVENVVADLAARRLLLGPFDEPRRVIYRDTMGVWDEILVRNGRFAGFRSLNERDRAAALGKVLSLSRV